MIPQEHKALWLRIEAFSIDDPGAGVRFSDKLARENNWSKDYTERVISEYKKFIFLCCVLPNGASPSDEVDQAWHMHLTYTINYWKEFCEKTIGREIHHYPSRGGIAEKKKHIDWYAETLKQYKLFFDTDPPHDIWPVSPSANRSASTPIAGRNEWIKLFLYFLPAFAVPFLFGRLSIFRLSGPEFLLFFAILLAGLVIALTMRYVQKRKLLKNIVESFDSSKSNVFQVTRFVYGQNRALQTAIIDLAYRGILVPARKARFVVRTDKYVEDRDEQNPLLPTIMSYYADGDTATVSGLEASCDPGKTFDANLYGIYQFVRKKDMVGIALLAVPLLIAVIRMLQGLNNDKPVSYLFMITLVCFLAGVIVLRRISYKSLMQEYFKDRYQQEGWTRSNNFVQAPAMDFAFLGIVALTGLYGNDIQEVFKGHRWADSSFSSGSGCGSSGCGSSCGSGCGGGGCGGCGGGD